MPASRTISSSKLNYRVTIIGAGRAGSAVGRLLHKAGCNVECVVSKQRSSAHTLAKELDAFLATTDLSVIPPDTNFILISTGDSFISSIAKSLSRLKHINFRKTTILHLSGALTRDVLKPLHAKGATTLALHPAFPFASRDISAERLQHVGWAVECEPKNWALAKKIVLSFGGVPVRIDPKNKIRYHAGCSVASNFLVVLMDAATRLFRETGISTQDAQKLLQPLVNETLHNLWDDPKIPINKKLTGPLTRGDVVTVRRHLASLKKFKDIENIYRQLSVSAVAIVEKNKNVSPKAIQELKKMLKRT